MTSMPIMQIWGDPLTSEDYAQLEGRGISREQAGISGIQRVTSVVAQQMFGRKRGDLAGMIIPNIAPWEPGHVREYRLRVDHPPFEQRADGSLRETQKYIQPTGRPNLLYFPVGVTPEMLEDINLPVLIVEGEFKAIAAWRCSMYGVDQPRFMPVSIAGVFSYRGTIGKTTGPNGERRDVKGILPDMDRVCWKGRRVIIAFDADAGQNPMVRAARSGLSAVLIERGATVAMLEWSIADGKGIDDWLVKVGPDHVLAKIAKLTFGDWRTRLLRNNSGDLIACYENACMMLENSPEFAGVLGYNEFTGAINFMKVPPHPISAEVGEEISDQYDTEIVRWLERRGVMVKQNVVCSVVDAVARRNSYHPIREYLESLPPWDGVPRIGTWLIDYCGVKSSDQEPNHFAMAIGKKFLISTVARVLEPGCKVDHMLVLEGPQGLGKSKVPRILTGDEYFADQLDEMGSKDASMQIRGIWTMELAELDALSRVEAARAKAFISQQMDRFRLPYGRRTIRFKRQCVFFGTTNKDDWLKDETGGRRFWPVRCTFVDAEALKRDRDQLWAEALQSYRAGDPWWLDEPDLVKEAMEEQGARYSEDPWREDVLQYADGCESVSIRECLDRIGIEVARRDQTMANRVARILLSAGWERYKKRVGKKGTTWRYRRRRD
jgi:predicted P-loop ATPase